MSQYYIKPQKRIMQRTTSVNSEVAEKFIRCYLWQTVIATFRIRKDDKQADAVTFHYNRHENDKYIQQSFNPTYPRNHFRTIRYEISHARHLKIIKNLYPAILSMKQHALRNFSKWYVAIAILSSFGYNPFKTFKSQTGTVFSGTLL